MLTYFLVTNFFSQRLTWAKKIVQLFALQSLKNLTKGRLEFNLLSDFDSRWLSCFFFCVCRPTFIVETNVFQRHSKHLLPSRAPPPPYTWLDILSISRQVLLSSAFFYSGEATLTGKVTKHPLSDYKSSFWIAEKEFWFWERFLKNQKIAGDGGAFYCTT